VDAVARQGERACARLDQATKVKQGAAEIGAACAVVAARCEVVHANREPRVGVATPTHLYGTRAREGIDTDIGLNGAEDRLCSHVQAGQVVGPVFVGR
jgi:hypothetical protein